MKKLMPLNFHMKTHYTPHPYKGKMIGKHMNLEYFKGTRPIPYEHVLYNLFKIWKL